VPENVKVKVQEFKSGGQVHIPLEIELSDHLLQKLLQQSADKKEQLENIHQTVAKHNLLKHMQVFPLLGG